MSKTNIKNTSVPSAYDTPMTTLEYLRKVESQNAQVLARADEIEEALNGKVAKSGDTMTGDLSVPNIEVGSNANVGKLNSEKLNQKYEGAIKAELHVDEEGITEFVNGSNAGRFDTARVIKPSEVKTEIYDNQEGKRMFFRLPYLEASAGEHRLLTEEDLGGQGINVFEKSLTFTTAKGNVNVSFKVINSAFLFACVYITPLSTGSGYSSGGNIFSQSNFDTELETMLSTFIPEVASELHIPLSCGLSKPSTGNVFLCPAVMVYRPSTHNIEMRIYDDIRADFGTVYFSGVLTR